MRTSIGPGHASSDIHASTSPLLGERHKSLHHADSELPEPDRMTIVSTLPGTSPVTRGRSGYRPTLRAECSQLWTDNPFQRLVRFYASCPAAFDTVLTLLIISAKAQTDSPTRGLLSVH